MSGFLESHWQERGRVVRAERVTAAIEILEHESRTHSVTASDRG